MDLLFKAIEDKNQAVMENNIIKGNVLNRLIRLIKYGAIQTPDRLKVVISQEIEDIHKRIESLNKHSDDYEAFKIKFEFEIRELYKYMDQL